MAPRGRQPLAERLRRCAALVLVLAGCAPDPGGPPNVVVYVIDTLRADALGAYGQPLPTSPVFDALAAEGTLYENAVAPAPWTLPSVASLLTGLPLCDHGVRLDGDRIPEDVATFAERFRAAGYRTANFHANPYAGEMSGLDRGFETTALFRGQAAVDPNVLLRWLEEDDRPFFLYLHSTEPHDPYTGHRESLDALGGGVGDAERRVLNRELQRYRQLTRADFTEGLPPGTTDNAEEQEATMKGLEAERAAIERLYAADVRVADANLGQVRAALERAGVLDRTILAVTSDHGEEFGEHGGWQHDQSLHRELLHVPLLIRDPRSANQGVRVSEPFSVTALLPRLFEMAGLGESPVGAPEVVAVRDNRKKYFEPFKRERGDLNVALFDGGLKAIYNAEPGTIELYDLGDTGERTDRAADAPERAAALRERARGWVDRCRANDRETSSLRDLDPEQRERLRALGYID